MRRVMSVRGGVCVERDAGEEGDAAGEVVRQLQEHSLHYTDYGHCCDNWVLAD